MKPVVVHLVISLAPGGLERIVVDLTNERNRRDPDSTVICCLDEPGALATQVEGGAVVCVKADRSRFPFDLAAVARVRRIIGRNKAQKPQEGKEGKDPETSRRTPNTEHRTPNTEQGTKNPASPLRRGSGLRRASQELTSTVVLHAHNLAAWQYGALATIGTGVKLVYTQHGANVHNRGFLNRLRCAFLARVTDQIVTVSESTAKAMAERQGIAREEIVVIPNGVRVRAEVRSQKSGVRSQETPNIQHRTSNAERGTKNQEPGTKNSATLRLRSGQAQQPTTDNGLPLNAHRSTLRAERGIPADAFVVGSVGRFSPEKNYPLLVRAFAGLRAKCPHAFLLLVGDGAERSAIEDAARDCGVTGCTVLPGLQDDVGPWLGAMDVFCLSSLTEGMSISLLEAGACGLPCVVTAVGGNGEIVQDGVTGCVVSSGDVRALQEALEGICRDASLCRRLGAEAARQTAKRFSLDATMSGYERVYDDRRG